MGDYQDMKRLQALQKVEANHELLELYRVEKESIDALIDQALNFPSGADRWLAYALLKKQAELLAGWNATSARFGSSTYYNTLTNFIDYLLPDSINDDEVPQARRYVNVDELNAWCAHAQSVFEQARQRQALENPPATTERLLLTDMLHNPFTD